MEKVKSAEQQTPGYNVDEYKDVKPKEVNNFRMQAALFLSQRQFTEEELTQINNAKEPNLVDIEFKGGLQLTKMTFERGTVMELYRDENKRFRITYDPNAQTVITSRETRS